MRVRHISVTGLFGVFDHEIPLNMDHRITIIHGLNGYGKTVILQMVHGVFNNEYDVIRMIPFERFEIQFSDEAVLRVEKQHARTKQDHGAQGDGTPRVTLITGEGQQETSTLAANENKGINFIGKSRVASVPQPQWLVRLRSSLPVRFIQTGRLNSSGSSLKSQLAVKKYSDELGAQIRSTLNDYAARSQELDRTFPARLLRQEPSNPLSVEDLRRRLSELEQERARLSTLGFLEPEKDLGQIPQIEDPQKRNVLSIYVEDVEEKLRVFGELAAKIELFVDIINSRFRYKRLSIRSHEGFVFITPDGALLPPTALSSGEQHELVMLYELLFKVSPNSLILIDEPELSLHLAWQQQFLTDLEKIVKLSGFDVLIATHSADIIGEHWDWTVELKGPAT